MAVKLGVLAKAYRNTGTWNSPTLSEVKAISDLSVDVTWDEFEAMTRESRVKYMVKTMLALGVTAKIQKGNASDAANVTAILAAALGDTVLDMVFLDGPSTTNGVTGYRFQCQVFTATESQNPGDVLYPEVTFKPCPPTDSGQFPQSVTVSGGVPVYTTIAA